MEGYGQIEAVHGRNKPAFAEKFDLSGQGTNAFEEGETVSVDVGDEFANAFLVWLPPSIAPVDDVAETDIDWKRLYDPGVASDRVIKNAR